MTRRFMIGMGFPTIYTCCEIPKLRFIRRRVVATQSRNMTKPTNHDSRAGYSKLLVPDLALYPQSGYFVMNTSIYTTICGTIYTKLSKPLYS